MHTSLKAAFVALLSFSSIISASPVPGESDSPPAYGSSSTPGGGVQTCTPTTVTTTKTKGGRWKQSKENRSNNTDILSRVLFLSFNSLRFEIMYSLFCRPWRDPDDHVDVHPTLPGQDRQYVVLISIFQLECSQITSRNFHCPRRYCDQNNNGSRQSRKDRQ